jgi:hypothetical protein
LYSLYSKPDCRNKEIRVLPYHGEISFCGLLF